MSIQYVNTGSSANAGNGDSIRLAFTKVNNNFALVATQVADLQQGKFDNITIAGTATFLDIVSTGTAQLNNVSIAGTVSGTSTFQNIIVEQVATVNDLYANTIASTNTATFQDVIVNGALYGEFTFNTLNVATTITTNDLNVGNSISVGQYQFIQTNNLSQDFAIVKDDINGLTFVLRNVHADSFAEINLQDNIQGGLSIVHQDSTNNSGNYDAGQNYIFGQTPSDTLNIGKYSDINFYANEAQYYDPNAAGAPSISISKTDGTVSFGSDMVYMNGISFQVVSDGSALVNGIPIQGGSSGNGYTGSQGDIGDLGYTGSAGLSGYTGSQGITGLSGYTGSVGFGYSGSKGDTGPQGISVTLVGSTATSAGLPLTGNPGDGWIVNNTGHLWFWNTISGAWNDIGTIVGPQGNAGPRGDQGLPGNNGNNGYTGSFGLTGYTGSIGNTGYYGSAGYTGSAGAIGYHGSAGYTGSAGVAGAVGYWGSKGYTGSAGTNGTNGYTGSAGTNGTNGTNGFTGSSGAAGFTGSAGTNGTSGYYGSAGYTGSVGSRGLGGYTGSAGSGYTGSAGTDGAHGYTGSAGTAGYTGSAGVGTAGYTGSAGVGTAGYTGSAGTDGANGYTGSRGIDANTANFVFTDNTMTVADNGVIDLATNGFTWTLGVDGTLNLPESSALYNTALVQATVPITLNANGSFYTFQSDGYLQFPNGSRISADQYTTASTFESLGDLNIKTAGDMGHSWKFGEDGLLTLPNGASIGSSGSLSGIPMTTDRGTVLFGNSPECVPTLLTHFHIMKEDASAVDLFLGDDFNYVKLPGSGETAYGVEIGTNVGSAYTWRFGTDGNLTFPNGDLTIGHDQFGDPAILAAPGKNIGLVSSGVGDGYEIGSSLIWVDSITEPTKIAGVTANNPLFAGAGDVGIVTGDYFYTGTTNVWNFGADGTFTAPGHLLPNADIAYDLGSPDKQWRHIYVNTGSIYLGGIKLSTENNQLSVQQVTNIGGQEIVVQNYALKNADRLVKDGQTLVLTTTTNGAAVIGVESTATDLIIGRISQGLGIQSDGTTVLSSGYDTSSPLVLVGGVGDSEGQDGGDIVILGGYSNSGQLGSVYIEGQYAEILTLDGIVIGNGDNAPWFFDNSDQGLEFPDATKQYTAYQGSTIVSDTAPTDALGRIWFNSTDGRAYVKYNDNWVDLNPQVIPSPETYLEGLTIEDTTISKTTFNDGKSISIDNEGRIVVLKTTGELQVPGDVVPEITSIQKLGTATKRWAEAHIDEIHTVIDGGGASTWLTAV